MDYKTEINKEIANIEIFLNQGRFQDAYNNCNKLILNFPDNSRLNKLKTKIEKIVYQHNISAVEKELKTLEPLWKEKRYEALVQTLSNTVKFVPGYAKAEKLLYKAQKLYRQQMMEQQKETLSNYVRTIEQAIKTGDFEKAITLCKDVLRKIPQHEKCGMLLAKAKNMYIDKKISDNETLLKSEKFNEIEDFLNDLKNLSPDSVRIKNLLKKAANREKITVEFAKKDFIYTAMDQILILFQKGKYDKTIEALRELLEVEPDNLKALELLKQSEKKFTSQLDREMTAKIKNLQQRYKDQKKKYPKDFIRL